MKKNLPLMVIGAVAAGAGIFAYRKKKGGQSAKIEAPKMESHESVSPDGSLFGNLIGKDGKEAGKFASDLGNQARDGARSMSSKLGQLGNRAEDEVKSHLAEGKDYAGNLISKGSKEAENLASDLGNQARDGARKLGKMGNQAEDEIKSHVAAGKDWLGNLSSRGSKEAEKMASDLEGHGKKGARAISAELEKLENQGEREIKSHKAHGKDWFGNFSSN